MAVWSLGMAFLVTSEIQLLFEYCREKRQETQAYASLFAVFTLFTGIGTLIGGYLPGRLGGISSTYQYSFFVGTACIAVCAMLRALLLPAGSRLRISLTPTIGMRKVVGQRPNITLRKLLLLSVSIFLLGFTFTVAGPYLNVIIQYRFAWPDERVSLLLSVTGAALFVGSLLMPLMLERFGAARAFAILFALNAALAFILGLPIGVGLFAGVLVLRGGLFTLLNNMIDSETMSAVAEQDRNRFAGLRSVFRSAGSALAAYIGGTVLEARDTLLPFLLTCAGLLLGWAWLWWVGLPIMRERRKPEGGPR
jgi:MFS transporter, DHA1 family, multidrug resistance protein